MMRKGWIAKRRRRLGARVRLAGIRKAKRLIESAVALWDKSELYLKKSQKRPKTGTAFRDGLTPLQYRTASHQVKQSAAQSVHEAKKVKKIYPKLARKIAGYKATKKH